MSLNFDDDPVIEMPIHPNVMAQLKGETAVGRPLNVVIHKLIMEILARLNQATNIRFSARPRHVEDITVRFELMQDTYSYIDDAGRLYGVSKEDFLYAVMLYYYPIERQD